MHSQHRKVVISIVAARIRELVASSRLAQAQLGRNHPTVGKIEAELEEARAAARAVAVVPVSDRAA